MSDYQKRVFPVIVMKKVPEITKKIYKEYFKILNKAELGKE